MHHFWTRYIGPIVEMAAPQRILEIGAGAGRTTRYVLSYCSGTGAYGDVIEPMPEPDLADVLAPFEGRYSYYPLSSHKALPVVDAPDIALIDGDPNWFTVYSALSGLFGKASDKNRDAPIIFVHGTSWPYGRRDMYYAPSTIDPKERHPYAYRGVIPGHAALADEGLNADKANAMHEGGARNGVLTAIEDFAHSCLQPLQLYHLPMLSGLSIIVPRPRMTAPLRTLIDGFFTQEGLQDALKLSEEHSAWLRTELDIGRARLMRKSDALTHGRHLLAEQEKEIARLRQTSSGSQ